MASINLYRNQSWQKKIDKHVHVPIVNFDPVYPNKKSTKYK